MNKRDVLNDKLLEIALKDKNSYFIFMDGTEFIHAAKLRGRISDNRIINAGISEQNAAGMAAGIAMTGKNVYLIGCAFFLATRAYEQIKDDIAYNNANVTILGSKSGIVSYPQGGFGHWGIDDIALMRNLPNMTVVNCATANELSYYLDYSFKHQGPMYLMDENCWCFVNPNCDIEIGKFSRIKKGGDFVIITTGHAMEKGLDLQKRFAGAGYRAALVEAHSLVPFDEAGLKKIIAKGIPIVSIDEHTQGGLTDMIGMVIAKSQKKVKWLPIYVNTDQCNLVGGYEYLAEELMGYTQQDAKIIKMLRKWHHCIIYPSIRFYGANQAKVIYKLFGLIPLLKTVSRKDKGKHLFRRKFYLFGFLRFA